MGYQLRGPWGGLRELSSSRGWGEDGKVSRGYSVIPEMKCISHMLSLFFFFFCGLLPQNCPNRFSWRMLKGELWYCLLQWYHIWSDLELTCRGRGDVTQPTIDYLAENSVVGDIWNLVITGPGMKPYWQSMRLVLITLIHRSDFWFHIKIRAKDWPRSACHFAQIPQEVVSAWLQAVQRSGHLQSSLVRCDFSQSTLQLLGVDQWRFGRKLILYSFCYCCCCYAITPTRWIPCQTVTPCCSDGQFFSKCRLRNLDSLPTETPSFPYAFLVVWTFVLPKFYIFQRLIRDLWFWDDLRRLQTWSNISVSHKRHVLTQHRDCDIVV